MVKSADSEASLDCDTKMKTEPNDHDDKTTEKAEEAKVNQLISVATSSATTNEVVVVQEHEAVASIGGPIAKHSENWVVLERVVLKLSDRNILLNNLCLNDKHMSYVQLLVKNSFRLF